MADKENQEEPKRRVGRPLRYETLAELEQAITAYFNDCDPHLTKRMVETGTTGEGEAMFGLRNVMTEQRPYTMSGLAHALKISRQTLLDYGDRPDYLDTIEDAKERVHRYTEEQLFGKSSTGAAFSLKNNWNWRDKQELDHTTNGETIQPYQKLSVEELKKLAKGE
ncbi:DNA-packaging protein [Rhodococcoides fascians]|uniref:DNA-packaging protein n=1 Tax=Rhodococcoides fascians TaxID=1828 RepID=UPI001E12F8C8|nr:DNA-packaging protein [Rhodococcus fascians]CAH0190927.1 hypothetical protein SRABI91_01671 [Rhodococcus fascians]